EAYGPAPILHHQDEILQPQPDNQVSDDLGVLLWREPVADRRARKTETGGVRGNQAAIRPQLLDDLTVQKGPGGVAMQQQHRSTLPLVDVMNVSVSNGEPVVLKRIVGGVDGKRSLWS